MAYEQARDLFILKHQFTPTGNKSNKERYRKHFYIAAEILISQTTSSRTSRSVDVLFLA